MGKSSPSPPPPPDPNVTAAAQSRANAQTARLQHRLNSTNQYTPWGNVTYDDLGNDRWAQNITLSPDQKALFDAGNATFLKGANLANQQLGQAASSLSQPVDFSDLGALPTADSYSADRTRVEQAMLERLEPQMAQDRARLEQQLANQGIQMGNEAYSAAQGDLSRSVNDARLAAILMGGQEQSRMFNDTMRGRQQAINERLTARTQPLNEVTALLGLGQVQPPPAAAPPQTGVAGTDVAGITQNAYNQRLSAYNTQAAQRANSKSMLGGLGGVGLRYALGGGFGGLFGK